MSILSRTRSFFVVAFLVASWSIGALAQTPLTRIMKPINESDSVTLTGNTHPMARADFDQGPVSAETSLGKMVLQLQPSAEQQAALDALVEAQHDPQSVLYHQWLTPAEYGARFGASAQDLAKITGWLASHGFKVEEITANNRQILFSGTAGQVNDTFHTEIHRYQVNGEAHIANAQDPQIPEALAGVVHGIVSLHDFRRNTGTLAHQTLGGQAAAGATPMYSSGSTHYLFPADWATIYDLNALYKAGTTGTGTSIAIVGRSDINLSDVTTFRSDSGLSVNNPTFIYVSSDPGKLSGDQDESTLDVEWAGAVAPSATVKFVIGASTNTTDGVDLSAQYIVNHTTAPVMSTSYGSCEADMGATEMAFYNSLWQQAASEGISAFVSSGDSGAAGCYGGSATTATGTGVNGLCSSTFSTCVGGTEFNEGSNYLQYWSASNTAAYGSALSYIPEVVWNESGSNGGSGLWASGGGASTYYAQPAWQKGVTGTSAANGMRAVPDVAMSASSHDGYVIVENGNLYVIAGTSAASPSFAGVMALLVQSKGGVGQGNANPGLYPLLNATHNPFHATPSGNNSVPGVTGFTASGASYNLATGLGSVDGALLLSAWGSGTASKVDFTLAPSATSGTVLTGKSTTFTVGVTASGTAKNAVALTASAPTGVTVSFSPASILPGATSTVTVAVGTTATLGTQNITITGTDTTGTQTATYALTVTSTPTLVLSSTAASVTVIGGSTNTVPLTVATGGSYTGAVAFTVSTLPTGVTAMWSANPLTSATGVSSATETLTLAAATTAAAASSTITITATGDGIASSKTVTLVVQNPAGATIASSPASISMQSLATATAVVTVTPTGGVVAPAAATGSSISVASGLPTGVTAAWSAASLNASGSVSWTLTLTGSAKAIASTDSLSIVANLKATTGTIYGVTLPLPLTVTLSAPTLTVTPASTALSVTQGAATTDVITLAGNGAYAGSATLSVTGLPTGVTATWSTNPLTLTNEAGSSTLTLAASSTAVTGAATVTVTATGDNITATKQITLQVNTAPGVHLSASPTTISALSLATTTATITATPVGGVAAKAAAAGSTITLASGLPKGFTATWSAPSLTAAGTIAWTLTLTGSSTAAAGTATLNLTANVTSSTGVVYPATLAVPMTVTLTPATLSVTPASAALSVSQSASVTDVVSLAGNATYTGAATLTVSGLPTGVTAAWSVNPITLTSEAGSSTLTLTASSTATAGAATVTVTAAGDGVTASHTLTLTVVASTPTLTVTTAASTMSLVNPVEAVSTSQSSASQVVSFTAGGSFKGPITMTVTGLPANLTAKWSSNPITLSATNTATSTLTITAGAVTSGTAISTVTPGTYTVTLTATGGGLSVTKTVVVQVVGLIVTPSVTTLTIHRGTSGTLTIAVTPEGGAAGVIAPGLAANASPNGITASVNTTMISATAPGSFTFTLTVSKTATLATYQLDPNAGLLASTTSSTPLCIGWTSSPVTLIVVQ